MVSISLVGFDLFLIFPKKAVLLQSTEYFTDTRSTSCSLTSEFLREAYSMKCLAASWKSCPSALTTISAGIYDRLQPKGRRLTWSTTVSSVCSCVLNSVTATLEAAKSSSLRMAYTWKGSSSYTFGT